MATATIRPTGAGAASGWTPNAGANWDRVDEAVADDDTTYVSTATQFQTDSHVFEDLGHPHGAVITSCTVHYRARKVTAGAAQQLRPYFRTGGQYYTDSGTIQTLTDDTSYHDYSYEFLLDPSTGLAWTEAGVDAGEWVYQKQDASPNVLRVTQFYVVVTYTVPPSEQVTTGGSIRTVAATARRMPEHAAPASVTASVRRIPGR